MGKKLKIQCNLCDMRKASEETLAAYEKIEIFANMLLVNPRAKALLAKYPVGMNCNSVLEVEDEARLKIVNGVEEISGSNPADGKVILIVNGRLTVGNGAEEVLKSYQRILVNGVVVYPESLSGALGMMTVNGTSVCYPDGAVVLKRNAVIDRTFALRARNRLYWAERRLVMVAPELNPEKLKAKGARFSSQSAIVAESKAEDLIELIDEKAEIILVPDGTAVITDDLTLDDASCRRYGRRMYVTGDLTVGADSREVLEQMEYLCVLGNASVAPGLRDTLLSVGQIAGAVRVLQGRKISDSSTVHISRWMLEREQDGIGISDCATVILDEDLDQELIANRLRIYDCAKVVCTPTQRDAVGMVCTDVAVISTGDDDDARPAEDPDTVVVNAGKYVL